MKVLIHFENLRDKIKFQRVLDTESDSGLMVPGADICIWDISIEE